MLLQFILIDSKWHSRVPRHKCVPSQDMSVFSTCVVIGIGMGIAIVIVIVIIIIIICYCRSTDDSRLHL